MREKRLYQNCVRVCIYSRTDSIAGDTEIVSTVGKWQASSGLEARDLGQRDGVGSGTKHKTIADSHTPFRQSY